MTIDFDMIEKRKMQDAIVAFVVLNEGVRKTRITELFQRDESDSKFIRMLKDLRTKGRLFVIHSGNYVMYFSTKKLRDEHIALRSKNKTQKVIEKVTEKKQRTIEDVLCELRKATDIGSYWVQYLGVAIESCA